MISFLEGKIDELRENFVTIDVNGVGYGVNISTATYDNLKDKHGDVRIYTYLSVKETSMDLFGFYTHEEKEVFLILLSVQGIGAKAAITILSNMRLDSLKKAIANSDAKALTKIPGLGMKKAERVVVELKDTFKNFVSDDGEQAEELIDDEYIQVLAKLGFAYADSRKALREVLSESKEHSKDEVIKEALKRLG
jgi:Holliday junction DNA helicase RuvA